MHWCVLIISFFFFSSELLALNFIVTKNYFLAAVEKRGPYCMKVIDMYYSSLPLPFIPTVGWSCIQWKSHCARKEREGDAVLHSYSFISCRGFSFSCFWCHTDDDDGVYLCFSFCARQVSSFWHSKGFVKFHNADYITLNSILFLKLGLCRGHNIRMNKKIFCWNQKAHSSAGGCRVFYVKDCHYLPCCHLKRGRGCML